MFEKSSEAFDPSSSILHTPSSFIDHFYFLNLKIPKKSPDFNLLSFLSADSTWTRHGFNLKIRFEELSIFSLIHKFTHLTTIFLRISKGTR